MGLVGEEKTISDLDHNNADYYLYKIDSVVMEELADRERTISDLIHHNASDCL